MKPIIELQHLGRSFEVNRLPIKAVDDVNLTLNEGEVVCLVGESGCGKTTTGKMIANLLAPTDGRILYLGKDINQMNDEERKRASHGGADGSPGPLRVAEPGPHHLRYYFRPAASIMG